jgi:hypothetical protein
VSYENPQAEWKPRAYDLLISGNLLSLVVNGKSGTIELVPSNKTEPLSSGKAEPREPAGVVGTARRARVAQLGARVKIAESGPAGSSGLMRRAAELPTGHSGTRSVA